MSRRDVRHVAEAVADCTQISDEEVMRRGRRWPSSPSFRRLRSWFDENPGVTDRFRPD